MLRGAGQRPVLTVLVGAVAIAFSGILFRLSHVSPSTGAFYRCVWALPPLWVLARLEDRRFGKRNRRSIAFAWVAGAFFAADLVLWHNAIEQVGAGLATVLGNVQVVLVGLLAWALLGERPHRSALPAIPTVGPGARLAPDLDVAAAPACRRDVDSPDVSTGVLRHLRRADHQRIAVLAAACGRSLHPRRARHGNGRPALHPGARARVGGLILA